MKPDNLAATFTELLVQIKDSSVQYDTDLITRAYEFAKQIHDNQMRLSGESYIEHVINVASLIVTINLDNISVVAALLHDTVEKGGANLDEIDKEFGTEVAFIVDGLTNLIKVSKNYSDQERDIENFKNLLFSSTEDLRILIIRLAEKLMSFYTIDTFPREQQIKSARKALNIYAPIAEYLGLAYFQFRIQDMSFKILNPEEDSIIESEVQNIYGSEKGVLNQFTDEIKELLNKYEVKFNDINYRIKSNYSIFKKIKRKYLEQSNKFDKKYIFSLRDIFAERIILNTVEECYLVLGLIHSKYEYEKADLDDYIMKPKENGYRSLQTTIKYQNTYIEVQIRTQEMHDFNEFGPASHIAYKLFGSKQTNATFTWTKDLLKWKGKSELTKEDFKIKAFSGSIFVFTPKGLVIRLREGSSPIDFAFRVHTKIGERYQGAKVNGKMVSMDYKLKTGDVIEVITTKHSNVNSSWLKFCAQNDTKSRIRRILRAEQK